MSTTRAAFRPLILNYLGYGEYQGRTASSAGAAGGTTTVDAALARYPNDYFNNWWEVLTLGASGAGSYEFVLVSDFVSSTGTLTHNATSGATQVASAAAFELLPPWLHPAFIHSILNQTLEQDFPWFYVPKRDETLVTDNLLANFSFESGTFTSWTTVGAGATVTANTTLKMHASQAANIVAGSGAAAQLTQAPTINIKEISGKTVYFYVWTYATAADVARIRLDWDGTNFENYAYHDAVDEWTHQKRSVAVPDTATQVKAIVEVAASGTARFDAARMWIDHIYRYTVPSGITHGPYNISIQRDEDKPEGPFDYIPRHYYDIEEDGETRYLVLNQSLPSGRILRLEGKGPLTTFSTDTGTTEVSAPRTRLVAAATALNILTTLALSASGSQRAEYLEKAAQARQAVERLKAQPGMTMPPQSVPISYRVQER